MPAATIAPSAPAGLAAGASLAAVSVADAAAEHLRGLLFSGSLEAGQELRDTVLAQELRIARPTVRIAVQRLVAEGLLEREPGQSARVRSFTAADVADLYRMRRLIECEAVRAVVEQRLDTAGIERAMGAFRAVGDAWGDGPDADLAFHAAVVDAAGSPRLTRLFAAVAAESRLVVALLRASYATPADLAHEHESRLEALRGTDADRAVAVWAAHLDDAERSIVASLEAGAGADESSADESSADADDAAGIDAEAVRA